MLLTGVLLLALALAGYYFSQLGVRVSYCPASFLQTFVNGVEALREKSSHRFTEHVD